MPAPVTPWSAPLTLLVAVWNRWSPTTNQIPSVPSREALIDALATNDRHGCYRDGDVIAEDGAPLTYDCAVDCIRYVLASDERLWMEKVAEILPSHAMWRDATGLVDWDAIPVWAHHPTADLLSARLLSEIRRLSRMRGGGWEAVNLIETEQIGRTIFLLDEDPR